MPYPCCLLNYFNSTGPIQGRAERTRPVDRPNFNSTGPIQGVLDASRTGDQVKISIPQVQFKAMEGGEAPPTGHHFNSTGPIQGSGVALDDELFVLFQFHRSNSRFL